MWKEIPGFEGRYEVNEHGEVYSKNRTCITRRGSRYTIKGRILKPNKIKNGYLVVYLSKNNTNYPCYIHRLVAEAFIPNPNRLPAINHIDGNKENCSVDNLEWVTYSENNQHAYDTGLKPKGEGQYKAKLKEKDVREIRKRGKTGIYESIANRYGVSKATVRDILLNRTWKNI